MRPFRVCEYEDSDRPKCFGWRMAKLSDIKAAGCPPQGIGEIVRGADGGGYRCAHGWVFMPWCRPAAALLDLSGVAEALASEPLPVGLYVLLALATAGR
jgi:hypothetical protein